MKEVTYLHAEGMPAGFLKHGTLSLIDKEVPSVFLIPPKENEELYTTMPKSFLRLRKFLVIYSSWFQVPKIIFPPRRQVWEKPFQIFFPS